MDDLLESKVSEAGGDYEAAARMLAEDLVGFTWVIEELEHDKKLMAGTIEFQAAQIKTAEPGFLTKLSNSTVFKVGLFAAGVWLGQEMVRVR